MSFSTILVLALILRLIITLGVIAGVAYLVSLPYLWNAREGRRPQRGLLLGYLPALLVGLAPVVVIAGVLVIRGPGYIYPAYVLVIVGVILGAIGPAMVPELRRRMIVGLPLLMVWAYLCLVAVMAGGGMPVRLDAPIRLLTNALG